MRITSLSMQDSAGPVSDFDPQAGYHWLMADFQSPILGFDPTVFTVDTTTFANSFTGQFSLALGDTVSGGDDSQLYVVYVPEPGLAVLGLTVTMSLVSTSRWWTTRRRTVPGPRGRSATCMTPSS